VLRSGLSYLQTQGQQQQQQQAASSSARQQQLPLVVV
jgi:hypothetical protein